MEAPGEPNFSLQQAWDEAIRSSPLDPSEVQLFPVPALAAPHEQTAVCYPPGINVADEHPRLLDGASVATADSPEHRRKYRIAIEADVDDDEPVSVATIAGKLRHELRHVEQQKACGAQLGQLDALACDIVSWKVGGLPESGTLYNLIPTELDANTASAVFLREHYPQQVEAVSHSAHAVLTRSHTAPGELAHLPAKTLCFIFGLREVAEEPIRSSNGVSVRDRLSAIDPRWVDLWDVLDEACRL